MSSSTRSIPRAKTKKRVVAEENEELLMEAWRQDEQMMIEKEMKADTSLIYCILYNKCGKLSIPYIVNMNFNGRSKNVHIDWNFTITVASCISFIIPKVVCTSLYIFNESLL